MGALWSGLTTVIVGASKSALLRVMVAPGVARAASSDWYSCADNSWKPACGAALASAATSRPVTITRGSFDDIAAVLSVRRCTLDLDRQRPGRELALLSLHADGAGRACGHIGECRLHLTRGVAALDAELQEVDPLVGQERRHERWADGLRRAQHKIHVGGREAECSGLNLVGRGVLVRIEDRGAILAVDGDHVQEAGARQRHVEDDLLSNPQLLPACGECQRFAVRGQRRQ